MISSQNIILYCFFVQSWWRSSASLLCSHWTNCKQFFFNAVTVFSSAVLQSTTPRCNTNSHITVSSCFKFRFRPFWLPGTSMLPLWHSVTRHSCSQCCTFVPITQWLGNKKKMMWWIFFLLSYSFGQRGALWEQQWRQTPCQKASSLVKMTCIVLMLQSGFETNQVIKTDGCCLKCGIWCRTVCRSRSHPE